MSNDERPADISEDGVERRYFPTDRAGIELREAEDGPDGIRGLGIPTGVTADIGPFTEEVSPDAVRDLEGRDDLDIRGLLNHDPNYLLGRTKSGTMQIRAADEGLEYDIPELPESRSDVAESVARGDLDGNSWAFSVREEDEDWDESGDKPHRVINRFQKVYDVGPVTFPAYEGHTTVSQRSVERAQAMSEDVQDEAEPVETITVRLDADVSELREKLEEMAELAKRVRNHLSEDRQTDQDIRSRIRSALQEVFGGDDVFIWIEATFMEEGEAIFQRESDNDSALFRIGFIIAEDGTVELEGEPVEVVRVTTYEAVESDDPEEENAVDVGTLKRKVALEQAKVE